ncbi:hypothetical protein WR30_18395 [Burkholderia contaminans FFH2055]|uniref:hypothetical protein n=1 Tax=Burkholderia contaminans TaxID=488447 RepID=UPI00062513CA|nr:hypothetical protein [Burkholderia contaminans]KKL35658.1 hypothetical protein WR30_18395 [Burkholderia contaminans FFH2055]MEB4636826.1 hypothetical protein [Burkholderia contaminans]MEB4651631.1 hypothetical protein [Burkholderia contaminans]MEB4661202.1 hypothetical protein [Burkholderia contaminans]MEB4667188.1 hypothetical protein [Burkholderia contaminans]
MNHEIECLQPPGTSAADPANAATEPPAATEDELVFEAKQKITLRCGKASITLYPNGKIALRGEYIVSDAAGVNRIAGGQIELN